MAQTAQINVSIDTKNAIKSIGELNNEIGDSIVTVRDLQMTVDALQDELETTEVGTERWKELKQAYIDANTELKNYELSIESLDNEQFASELRSVVGGLTDMAGGLALVGVSGQKMEELVQTFAQVEGASRLVTGAMEAFSSGQKIMNNITTRATKAQQVLAAATLKGGVAAKAASVGMGILNAVMNLNPVFLIITGITALVGALAFFITSTNDAAEANERLNAQMEAQNKLTEVQRGLRQQNQKLVDNEINNQKKILEGEKKILESKENLTDADKERIETIEDEIKALDELQLVAVKEEAVKQTKENTNLILDQFKFMKNAINATDYEDGVNDIDYSEALEKTERLRKQFVRTNNQFEATGDIEKYQKTLTLLTNNAAKLSKEFSLLDLELGEAESEEWQNLIDGTDKLVGSLQESGEIATELVTTIQDEEAAKVLGDQASQLDEITQRQEEARKAREAANKAIERRRKLLQEIDGIIKRESNAVKELERVRAQSIEDETERNLKLNELRFGAERDKLIEGAIKREEAALQEKFVNGRISEEEYRESINDLYENGADYLLDVEKELLEEKKKVYKEEEEEILRLQQVRVAQAKTTSEQIDVINQRTATTRLEQEKQNRIFEAQQTITDQRELEQELLKINKEFADREIQQINKNLKEELDLRTAQYKQDLLNKELTTEEKALLEAEYNNDIVEMNAEAQQKIKDTINSTNEQVRESTFVLTEQQQLIFDSVVQGIQQSMQIMNDILAEVAARAAYEREQQYQQDTETLNQQLANRTLSQEQYNAKLAELEQKKRVEEIKARRKQFKIDKANDIVQATISTAQAVLQGLAAAPPPVGPILAAVNGALGAIQIGVISAQQFRAARGGVVPGAPSERDSVPSLLAPGETVINSNSSQMFAGLLSAINESGGGVPLVPSTLDTGTSGGNKNVYRENSKNQPIRAYVVESDVSENQKRIRRIRENAEF